MFLKGRVARIAPRKMNVSVKRYRFGVFGISRWESERMNFEEIKQLIMQYKNKVHMKLCSNDYAKGYCSGVAGSSEQINEDEYNELSKLIDDVFVSKGE